MNEHEGSTPVEQHDDEETTVNEQQSAGEKLVAGLNKMVDNATPDDDYWCPKCEKYAEFAHVTTVRREEFGVGNHVWGCPDCRYVLVPATEWQSLDGGDDGE